MNKASVYRHFARQYGWTPQQVAAMTPAQQRAYLHLDDKDFESDANTMTFADDKAYKEYLRNRDNG